MCPFINQQFFMHTKALDVCIQVNKIQYVGPEYVKIKASYYNLGYTGNPWLLANFNNFIVNSNEYPNWIRISKEQFYKNRTKAGIP